MVFIYKINDSDGGLDYRPVLGEGKIPPPSPESTKEITETFA